ncbi:RNase Gf29 [Gloeophyllum trabeum ATCC 11539]|uniref:Ribonuclease T2-like n=1 Tax=Gloeophyllum trabeum (strain ATCC 11539 / FP-39264 / Madison 617) TaxID=670483 RepID=S7QLX6_GLOTA|nr:RNase Gf29 [Gloeophyllum trabeum ATCC 11539]EPQ60442.1 RNase Gf29 [Gloeophyllum trabeum ATCC 11539]
MLSIFMVGALLPVGVTLASPLVTPVGPMDLFKRISSGCSTSGSASCHNTTVQKDLCCFEAPGGLLLQTQFWDTDPSTGPSDSWTIHGLWPDNCDGTYEENCDPSRDYTDIASLLEDQGASDTLSYMQQYWVDINGKNEQFWEHEWSTHGTCYSTLEPSCLPSGSPKGAEAVAFFETVVKLFKTLPTYDWLKSGGITPSSSKTYSLSTLTSALESAAGVKPALSCDGSSLNSISWYFNLKGSLIDGNFVAIDAPEDGSCPSSGIKYPPKSGSGSGGGTTTVIRQLTYTIKGPGPTSGGLPSKAHITASTGGLLSAGTWSTQTLATYTLSGSTSGFTMSTSKGKCAVSGGTLTCGSSVSFASTFSAVSSGGNLLLAYGGSTAWTADATPSGTTQETVYTGSSHSEDITLSIVST